MVLSASTLSRVDSEGNVSVQSRTGLASSDGESAMGGIEFTPLSRLISCPNSINSYSVISYIARLIAADAAETRETYCTLAIALSTGLI